MNGKITNYEIKALLSSFFTVCKLLDVKDVSAVLSDFIENDKIDEITSGNASDKSAYDGFSCVQNVLIMTGHEEYLDPDRYSNANVAVAALYGYIDGLHASGYLDDDHYMSCLSEIQLFEEHVKLDEADHFDPVDGCDWKTGDYDTEVNNGLGYYDNQGWYHSYGPGCV